MTEPVERGLPDWTKQERAGDLAWIAENLFVFYSAAQLGIQTAGWGAIVIDTTARPTGEGHPLGMPYKV